MKHQYFSYSFFFFVVVICCINKIDLETLSSQAWSNLIQDISLKSQEKLIETHPINEGFMLLNENAKKSSIKVSSPTTKTLKPSHSTVNNRIIKSHNISSTTCKTITITQNKKQTTSSPKIGHIGRKLLNELSYDTDIDSSSMKTSTDDENEFDQFLKMDDEQLSRQLFNAALKSHSEIT